MEIVSRLQIRHIRLFGNLQEQRSNILLSLCLTQLADIMKRGTPFLIPLTILFLFHGCKITDYTCTLHGYITSKNTGEGIEDCRVSLPYFDPELSAYTSEDGYYRIDDVPVKGYRLVISDKAYFRKDIILSGPECRYDFQFETEFTDPRDQKTYQVVEIFDQVWMAENLNYGQMIDSTLDQSDNDLTEKYCPGNDESRCSVYGGYYQWDEMMDYGQSEKTRGICPEGWHIPGISDFHDGILNQYYRFGSQSLYFKSLIKPDDPNWTSPSISELDTWLNNTGFAALPGGYHAGITFYGIYAGAFFWSSSSADDDTGMYFYISEFKPLTNFNYACYCASIDHVSEHTAMSVRCIKD
jgi:uncharacterized protein (TIGR02145 family)